MPLYEFICRKCGHEFEELVTMRGGASDAACPKCQGKDLDQLFGLPAVGRVAESSTATNCRGDGPPCGAPWCGRKG
jgi:putative FmdB family regulatory protein